jgi:glycosyltransferase involved in cell wall biosynthesis
VAERHLRTLVVAEAYPWPAVDGYKQRLSQIIGGLALAGPVDLVALHRPGAAAPAEAPWPGVERSLAPATGAELGVRAWLGAWVRGPEPRRVLGTDWSELIAALPGWAGEYDLVWYSHVHTWWPVHTSLPAGPAIVDFDNLEHLALRLRRSTPPEFAPGSSMGGRAAVLGRWAVSRGFDLVDERRWDALQRRCAGSVDRVVVCSDLDARRSGVSNVSVVPNGAEPVPDARTDRRTWIGDAPTLTFVGALDYGPNTDAVGWFVREVLPIVRAHRPGVRLRVVGRGAARVDWVRDEPGVELVGEVDDVRSELDRTDVSVVPIRVGAGTRLKVLEALAHHLPLVTTTVGCEGVDVEDGRTALIADDPRTFADACLRMLDDDDLRQRLADAGAELFADRYSWPDIRERVAGLADEVASGRSAGTGPS